MARRPSNLIVLCLWAAGAALAAGGCAMTRPVPADVHVPPELLRGSPYTAAGEPPRSRYVVRMTDGQRDWEIQLPEIATAYEVRVPLGGKPATPLTPDMATLTAADREILQERQSAQGLAQGGGAAGGGSKERGDARKAARGKAAQGDDDDDADDGAAPARADGKGKALPRRPVAAGKAPEAQPPRASYLLTLARVKDLYRSRHYELALVELVELEKQYPEDEHILSMKGSLYERLGNKNLARDAWQQALTLNPFNLAVLEALQRLGK